jgi:PAS domain S-box-containing protein
VSISTDYNSRISREGASPGSPETATAAARAQSDPRRGGLPLDAIDVLEAAPDALVAADASGRIVLVNAQTERLFGYQRDELLGRPIELLMPERLRAVHAGHRARYGADPYVRPMGSGVRLACRRKDGSDFWAEISLSPVRTGGNLTIVCAIRDVTERLRAEDERASILAREHIALQAAENAMREREQFLRVAAHELKTPITSLRGYAQLLVRQLNRDGVLEASRALRAVEIMDRSAGRLAELVGQLLDLSRIQAGNLALECQEVDLTTLVRRETDAARVRATEHRFLLRVPARLSARVDPLRLEQVLSNLLDNAVKVSPTGSRICVLLARRGTVVSLSVRDHGPGIPPEQRAHLFERFHQVHTGDQLTRRPGMGLGLYLSRQIIELHGGRIEARFPRDGGVRFVVWLPAAADASA